MERDDAGRFIGSGGVMDKVLRLSAQGDSMNNLQVREPVFINMLRTGTVPDSYDQELAVEEMNADFLKRLETILDTPRITRREHGNNYKFRKDALAYWGNTCEDCKQDIPEGQLDLAHILPYELYPDYGYELWNVRPKHRECHKKEGQHSFRKGKKDFLKMQEALVKLGLLDEGFMQLVQEIKSLRIEAEYNMRWDLIKMYHGIGELVVSCHDTPDLLKLGLYTGISKRNMYRAIQFYKKFPDLDLLPDGKNSSWYSIVNKHLPDTHKIKEHWLEADNVETFWPKTGSMLKLCTKCIKNNEQFKELL